MVKFMDYIGLLVKGLKVLEVFGVDILCMMIIDVLVVIGLDCVMVCRCFLILYYEGYLDYDGKFFMIIYCVLRLGMGVLVVLFLL